MCKFEPKWQISSKTGHPNILQMSCTWLWRIILNSNKNGNYNVLIWADFFSHMCFMVGNFTFLWKIRLSIFHSSGWDWWDYLKMFCFLRELHKNDVIWLKFLWIFKAIFFQKIFFLMWTIFKVFMEFVTIWLLFSVLVFWPRGMWDLSCLTRDWTHTPCAGLPGKSWSDIFKR